MSASRHTAWFCIAITLLLIIPGGPAARQLGGDSIDDDDFRGWISEGDAFADQPVDATASTTDRFARVSLGGDYWKHLPYPLGQQGDRLVMSGVSGDTATGTFTSPPFRIERDTPFLSFLIGGAKDIDRVRLELRISGPRDADQGVVYRSTGGGHEQLEQRVWRVPDDLFGRVARVVLVDESRSGHLNVDAVRLVREPPSSPPPPVWGYADYHTHPMTYLAFGALKAVRTIWGSPGGRYADYQRAPDLVAMDMPACIPAHGGGPYAEPFLNAAQTLQYSPKPNLLFTHPNQGWPEYKNFPAFLQGTHQQMHITQIRRNYDGGLRLMVALTTDNAGAEYLMSPAEKGRVNLVAEKTSLLAQLAGMKELALLNADWMQIAYSPAEARQIILQNKLAVVLGTEMDRLGTYGCGSASDEVEFLWNQGVRVVTPIHAMDNLIGGPAVFIGPYNWLNDLFHRRTKDVSLHTLHKMDQAFFDVEEQKCELSDPNDGECIQNRLEPAGQQRLFIGSCLVSFTQAWFLTSPCLDSYPYVQAYDTTHGHANRKGLTDYGREYLQALMAQGIILDTAHMSDKSVTDTFVEIGKKVRRDHPLCRGFPVYSDCDALAYPTIISHAHFRGQAFYGGNEEFVPSEYDISDHNLELVRRVGGVVGPFVAEDRISTGWDPPNPAAPVNDCPMSSKSFAFSYRFAAQRLGRYGVGMATDLTLIPGVAPRFGDNACWGYNLAKHPGDERRSHPDRYNLKGQSDPVSYDHNGLKPYLLAKRTFDFNKEGLAHYGLIPDMLQDLKNVGMPDEDRALLFRSADDYIKMWERTARLAGK
jgi:microsomal dipeptidase-like Zn-dependent dipeptidase